jgi:hypothetical protein
MKSEENYRRPGALWIATSAFIIGLMVGIAIAV